MKIAETIIHKALDLTAVKILRCERKSGKQTGSGLIKIELERPEDLKRVLKVKKELKNTPVKEMQDIYLRQAKKSEQLVLEQNMNIILCDMGMQHDYRRLPSGHLVHREQGEFAPRSYHRGASGHGRGGRGASRGGRGRRMSRGPMTGEYDPTDQKVVQREECKKRDSINVETTDDNDMSETQTNRRMTISEYMQ